MTCSGPVVEQDVVWYLGARTGDGFQWKPQDQVLGGSEQAVVELSRAWTNLGLSVAVYGAFENQVYDGVSYYGVEQFRGDAVYNTLILWRAVGALAGVTKDQLCARRLAHEVQDSYLYPSIYPELTPAHKHAPMGGNVAAQVLERFDSVVVKSLFHAEHMGLDPALTAVIPNGIRHHRFSCNGDGINIVRERARFVYASDYSRGLEQILRWFWPALRESIPDAELHIYYGMELHKPAFRGMMADLLDQPGVYEYGKRPVAEISAAKCAAAYHLYYTRTTSETDCVSIRESAFVGCIPILSEHHVFRERAGLHVPGDPEDEDDSIAAAELVAKAVTDPDQSAIASLRGQLVATESEHSWDDQARVWVDTVLAPSARTARTVAAGAEGSAPGKKQTTGTPIGTPMGTSAGARRSGGGTGARRPAVSFHVDTADPGRIPRRIIQTWKTANLVALPLREQGFVRRMLAANQDYHHQLFDDVGVEDFVYTRCAPRWIALYESLPTVIQRLDLFRVLAVYELGGFYFDIDMSIDGPLDALLGHQAVFAEEVHSNTDAILRVRGITNLYANYAFGGTRRHPVFLRILETMEAAVQDPAVAGVESGMTPFKRVLFTTGPVMLTRAVADFVGDTALPKGERAGIGVLVHAEENQFGSYGTHHLMHSWVKPGFHDVP